jgi:hypothetical protein
MQPLFVVEGPFDDVRKLREDVIAEFGDYVQVGRIEESIDGVFDSGRLGDSPIVSFLIEYAAQIAGGGTVATVAAIRNLLRARKAERVAIREASDNDEIGDSRDGDGTDRGGARDDE